MSAPDEFHAMNAEDAQLSSWIRAGRDGRGRLTAKSWHAYCLLISVIGSRKYSMLVAVSAAVESEAKTMPAQLPSLRVLVVDDNDDAAQSLCYLLESMGCEAVASNAGPDGLALAGSFEPQLAIIDLEMPGMKGCEMAGICACRIRDRSRSWCASPAPAARKPAALPRCGFDEFITKPVRAKRWHASWPRPRRSPRPGSNDRGERRAAGAGHGQKP
jgi:CheY-like chemotaxis protein